MSAVGLSLLGTPRLGGVSIPVKLDTRKNLALNAYLAMSGPSASHSLESLLAVLWPEGEPSRARAGPERSLSVLKKALAGIWMVVDRETASTDGSLRILYGLPPGWQNRDYDGLV
jgi:DNA-binding SARP family transcriptional activator